MRKCQIAHFLGESEIITRKWLSTIKPTFAIGQESERSKSGNIRFRLISVFIARGTSADLSRNLCHFVRQIRQGLRRLTESNSGCQSLPTTATAYVKRYFIKLPKVS